MPDASCVFLDARDALKPHPDSVDKVVFSNRPLSQKQRPIKDVDPHELDRWECLGDGTAQLCNTRSKVGMAAPG